jgi:hypothetical protein
MTRLVKGCDLQPGDVIMMGDNGRRDVRTTIIRTGALVAGPATDRFGRHLDAALARREDTGREGIITYGPDGVFLRADPETPE